MIFKQIYLYPDRLAFPTEFVSSFQDKARYLCHFIGKEIAAIKLHTPGFNRLCVIASNTPQPKCDPPNSTGAISIEVAFEREEYEKLTRKELPEYFLRLLSIGFEKAAKEYPLPLEQFNAAISKLRTSGYKNQWTHVEKTLRKERLKCKLSCELTMDRFSLTLDVARNGEPILHQEVLATPPDEISFHYRFKELKLLERKLVVLDRFGGLVCEFDPLTLEYTTPPPDWRHPFPNGELSAREY